LFPADALATDNFITIQNTSADRTGNQFELRGIVPGLYELMAAFSSNGRQAWGRTRVQVSSGELSGVVLDIHPGAEVRARLTVDGAPAPYTMQNSAAGVRDPRRPLVVDAPGAIVPSAPVPASGPPVATPTYRIQLRSAEGLGVNVPFEGAANQMTFDPSGVFLFSNVLEGKYSVTVTPLPPTAYVADVKIGGTTVFDSGFDVNSQTAEIQVLVNTHGAKIQGRVLDAAQKPFASARVTLVPRETRRQNTQLYRVASADVLGNFIINGVAPGDYKLFAWENVPSTAWMNAEFMAPYEGRGSAIIVSANGSSPASIELKVIPRE
jgi:hypothetical protein